MIFWSDLKPIRSEDFIQKSQNQNKIEGKPLIRNS